MNFGQKPKAKGMRNGQAYDQCVDQHQAYVSSTKQCYEMLYNAMGFYLQLW